MWQEDTAPEAFRRECVQTWRLSQAGRLDVGRWPDSLHERDVALNGMGILFEEPNPTGSRPRGLIGLYRKWQRAKSRDPNQLGSIGNGKQERERGANTSKVRRARRRWCHGGSKWGEVKHREEGGGDRGSTAARPTLTRDWGKKQNPNQKLGGTSGQRPSADSQC